MKPSTVKEMTAADQTLTLTKVDVFETEGIMIVKNIDNKYFILPHAFTHNDKMVFIEKAVYNPKSEKFNFTTNIAIPSENSSMATTEHSLNVGTISKMLCLKTADIKGIKAWQPIQCAYVFDFSVSTADTEITTADTEKTTDDTEITTDDTEITTASCEGLDIPIKVASGCYDLCELFKTTGQTMQPFLTPTQKDKIAALGKNVNIQAEIGKQSALIIRGTNSSENYTYNLIPPYLSQVKDAIIAPFKRLVYNPATDDVIVESTQPADMIAESTVTIQKFKAKDMALVGFNIEDDGSLMPFPDFDAVKNSLLIELKDTSASQDLFNGTVYSDGNYTGPATIDCSNVKKAK